VQTLSTNPNILLFVFDSFGTDDYLTLAKQLPCMDALRTRSMWFPRAYCGCPESSPARASLFSGLDMAVHGVWTDGVSLPVHETTIAERLTTCGYQTWLFGRRQLAGLAHWTTEHPRAQEFSYTQWAHGPLHRSRQNAYLQWLQATAGKVYDELFPHQADSDNTHIAACQRKAMAEIPDELSFNHWLGAQLSEQILLHSAAQPFFAVAGFVVGEGMGSAPSEGCMTEAVNQRALRQADAAMADVLYQLNAAGQGDKTIVVMVSARGSMETSASHDALHERAIKVPLNNLENGHWYACVTRNNNIEQLYVCSVSS